MAEEASMIEAASERLFDPIAMEVFSNRLLSITEDMGNRLIRASFSPNIKERKDCSVAMFDRSGRLISQAAHIPMHLGSLAGGVEAVLRGYGLSRVRDGDGFMCNDAYLAGGTHAPDITVVTPIFCDGECRFFAANIGHHSDVGGSNPGSLSPTARTVFEEGIRIPLVRIVREGELDRDMLSIVTQNSREPEDRVADLQVQIACNDKGAQLMMELLRQLGFEAVERSIEDILTYTSRRIRNRISSLRDGRESHTCYLDDDGFGGDPVAIKATAIVAGDHLTIDFEGSGPQCRGSYNMPESAMRASVYCAVKTMLDPDLMPNEGMFGALTIKLPEGTITNPRFPAAVGMRSNTAQRVVGAVVGALAHFVAREKVMAAGLDAMPAMIFSGKSRRRAGTYVYVETIGGGGGGRAGRDGADGIHVHITNTSNLPAEALENEYPLMVEEYSLVPDSGGYGEHRGGLGIVRQIQALDDDTFCYASSEGTRVPADGVFGGGHGAVSHIIRDKGTPRETEIPANQPGLMLAAGQSVRIETPGGGGFGAPERRAVEAIATDLRAGKVTREKILLGYGEGRLAAAEATAVVKAR
jgi:N-methylhydantoinase B